MMIMKRMYNLYRIFLFLWISFVVCIWGIYLYAYISPKIVLNSANRIYLYDNKEELVFESKDDLTHVSVTRGKEAMTDDMLNNYVSSIKEGLTGFTDVKMENYQNLLIEIVFFAVVMGILLLYKRKLK